MIALSEIKDAIDYQQTDDNFIEYLRVLNLNGIIIFNEKDISKNKGELFASEHLYNQITLVYGNISPKEGVKIGE
ncbi:hypothetical protein [Yersinia pekkanenii]|uniref:Uncharacterized protein n=1 Tax=Yersinia pekkanenii TaxID=1288385 RepID=A0A0T9R7M8_9GAMM|nr:hypothetical protein [Yersinia pekkanenii]CNI48677.1 Uncharacterised protein [Yersinia pekkanenii]CRY68224.1 Uncharacterised protein [Yersinia pekkanenii]